MNDLFTVKLDSNGNLLWARTMSAVGPQYIWNSIIAPQGGVVAYGTFDASISFDPVGGTDLRANLGGADGYLVSLKADGSYGFSRVLSTSGDDAVNNVHVTGNAASGYTLYVSGSIGAPLDLAPYGWPGTVPAGEVIIATPFPP